MSNKELDEELKGARYTSEDDEDESLETLAFKINALRGAIERRRIRLAPSLEDEDQLMRKHRLEREEKERRSKREAMQGVLSDEESEALAHGIDWSVLREIKESFDMELPDASHPGPGKVGTGRSLKTVTKIGITEDEFMEDFGPSLSRHMSQEKLRLWFRIIDDDCTGSVSWPELSNYLVNSFTVKSTRESSGKDTSTLAQLDRSRDTRKATLFVPDPFEGEALDDRISVVKRRHKMPMSCIAYSSSLDCFYTGSTDGMVHCWNPTNFHTLAVNDPKNTEGPIHRTNSWVSCLVYLPHNHRLVVLQADRSIFIYDTFIRKGVHCHELHRAYATNGKAVRRTGDGSVFYDGRLAAAGAGVKDEGLYQSTDITETATPVTLLEASNDGILTIDHMGGSSVAGEPIVAGMESGNVEIINLLHGSIKPIKSQARFKVHDGWVTKVKFAPELGGVITCSLDESAAVLDVEKGVVLQRMRVSSQSKPLFGFDYHRFHNVLTTMSGRTVFVWNALTGARLAALNEHDSPVVQTCINASKWHLYALTEDKTVKVWDLRTYKPLGAFEDEKRRYPSNSLAIMFWSDRHHMLYSGCSELFGWRPVEIQDRLDAGLVASTKQFAGHLRPINHMLVLPTSRHIVGIDSQTTVVWGSDSGTKLTEWRWAMSSDDSADRITGCAISLDGTRLLVGTEQGRVLWLNYATGGIIAQLKHSEGQVEVGCVNVMLGLSSDAPPVVYAGAGYCLLMWVLDREAELEVATPFAAFRTTPQHGIVLTVAMADEERQLIVVTTSNGYYLLLTLSLAPLSQLQMGIVACEHIRSITSGIFLGCHADGIIRCFALSTRGYEFYEICSWSGSHDSDDPITSIAIGGDTIVVGDAGGFVSIFKCTRLFNQNYIKYTVVPKFAKGDFDAGQPCLEDVKLRMSFRGHQSSVTGVAILDGENSNNSLVTCSLDRQIRRWASGGVGECSHEFGNVGAKKEKESMEDPESSKRLSFEKSSAPRTPKVESASSYPRVIDTKNHSYLLTGYSQMDGGHTLNTKTRKLSFADGALELPKSRNLTSLGDLFYGTSGDRANNDKPGPTMGASRSCRSTSFVAPSQAPMRPTNNEAPSPTNASVTSPSKCKSLDTPTPEGPSLTALTSVGSTKFVNPLKKQSSIMSFPGKRNVQVASSGGGTQGGSATATGLRRQTSIIPTKRKPQPLINSVADTMESSQAGYPLGPNSVLRAQSALEYSPSSPGYHGLKSPMAVGLPRAQSVMSNTSEDSLPSSVQGGSNLRRTFQHNPEDRLYKLASKPLTRFHPGTKKDKVLLPLPVISQVQDSILEVAHIKNVRSANESGGNTDQRAFNQLNLPKLNHVMKDVMTGKKEVDKNFLNQF